MQLTDVLEEYIFDCELRKLSHRTIKSTRNNNLRLFTYLASTKQVNELEEVTRNHIQSFIKYMIQTGHKETYINGMLKSFRGFFGYCVEERYIKVSPTVKVKFQKEEIPIIRTFNNEEVERMISFYSGRLFLQQRNKLIMIILFDSGIRNSELCDLRVNDVFSNAIKIHGKGKKIRYVPMTPSINKFLMKYLRIDWCQHLCNGLLYKSVCYCWYS